MDGVSLNSKIEEGQPEKQHGWIFWQLYETVKDYDESDHNSDNVSNTNGRYVSDTNVSGTNVSDTNVSNRNGQ